jgi:cytochrome P450
MDTPDITIACPVGGRPEAALDMLSPEFGEHLYAVYAAVRECPVLWSTENGGHWFLSGYQEVWEAARDHGTFSSADGVTLRKSHGPATFQPPITTDPPDTQAYRSLTLGALSPGAVDRLRPVIQQMTDELVDDFIEDGRADLVAGLLTPLPARMILYLLGLDQEQWPSWVELVHQFVQGATVEDMVEASTEMVRRITDLLAARRASGDLGDDLCGLIMRGAVHGRELSEDEQVRYMFLMLAGGMDTTSGFSANTVVEIARDQPLRKRLIEERHLLASATEEFLRMCTPTQGLARHVSQETEFHGQTMAAGDTVMVMYAAANRDPRVFADPDVIDIERTDNRHLAFGIGVHRCLGSNLARVMFQIMLTAILDRLPDFELVDERVDRYENASIVYAPRSLPVRFTPGGRRLGRG